MNASMNVTQDDAGWRLLSSQSVSREPGGQGQTMGQVMALGRELGWPAPNLAQLRLALSDAIRNVVDRAPAPGALVVRVFVRDTRETAVGASPVAGAAQEKPRGGWGFFLVQKSEENVAPATGAQQNVIELFLYQERSSQSPTYQSGRSSRPPRKGES